jgi:hypothetical protein
MSYFTMGYGMIPSASASEVKQAVQEIAPAIIEEQVGTVVDDKIDTKIEDAVSKGESNDIRSFSTRESFPATGIKGVGYIAEDTGYDYFWDGTKYVIINEHSALTESDIDSLDW